MAVSVVTIFAAAALLAIAASSLIAWQLQSYVDNNDNLSSSLSSQNDALHLSSASLQLSRMNDFLLREVQRMRLSTNETQRMVLAEANTPLIRTSAGALSAVNRTMFNSFAHRVTYGEELYGFAVNFLYPADTDNVTSVQSIQVYADPLFDGSLQPIHAWTDPSSGQTSAYQINLVSSGVVTASGDNTIPIVDTSMEQYDFNYLASAQIGIGYASRFDMLPWQSSDGNPWWFLQQCASLKMQGVNTVVQTYASTVYWEQKLTALLTTPDAYFVLFTKDLIVIASSYPAFKSQRNACIKSNSGAALVNCISATLTSNDSQPIFQYIGAHVIPNAASTGHLVANTNDTHYIRMVLPGSGGVNTVVVVPPPIQLEGPTGEQLGLVWFQVGDAAALSQSSTASSSTVPALIAMIVIVAVLSTAGVGGLVHRSFIAPMDVMIEQMIAVTELDMEAIDAVAATRETAPHNNGGQLTASSSEGRSGANFAEMNLLQHAFAKMAASMQLFLLYLPREVVRDLMTTGHTAKHGGAMVVQELTERRLTVLFADIVNFTSATAALRQSVDVFVELLQLYFEQATTALLEEGCTIDKYIGDAIMGFWGAPLDCPEQCSLGCEGALRLADEVDRMKPEFATHGWDLAVRIGVHSGPAMVGSIGSKRRLNFTALGNTVNVASRIEGLCKTTKTPINITSAVLEGLPASTSTKNASVVVSEFVVRGLGLFVLKGTNEPIPVFQLCGYARQTTRPMLSRRRSTASGNTSRRSDMQSSARMRLHSSAVEMQAPRDYVKKVFSQDSIQVIQKLHDAQAAFDEGNLAVSLTHFQDAHKSLVDGLQTIDADALRHVNIHAARLDEIIAGVAQRLAYQHEHPHQRFDPVVWMNDK